MTAGGIDVITGAPTVFEGNFALRLNDQFGGNDISALTQSVTNFTGNKIYYAWNAVLEPSHEATDSPSFIIKIIDETTGIIAPHLREIPDGNNNFVPLLGDMFTVGTADSVSGEFASVAQPTSSLPANRRFDVLYGPNKLRLVLTPGSFGVLGHTEGWRLNAMAAAEGTRLDDDATPARFRNKQRGFAAGVHVVNTEDTRIGIDGGYKENEISTHIGSRADVNGGSVFLYGSHDFGRGFNLSGVLGWHCAKAHTKRDLTLMSGTSTSRADYKLTSLNAEIEARYDIAISANSILRPVIGLTIGQTKAKGFHEVNADPNLALSSPGKTWSTTQSKVGAEIVIGIRQKLRAHIFANWMHDLNGNSTANRLMSLGGADWRVESVGIKGDTASFGIGLSTALTPSVTLRADYRGIRDFGNYNVNRGSIGVSFAF